MTGPVTHRKTSARREAAGVLADGTAVDAVVLANANGVSARILSYGATLQALIAPDAHGRLADVVLGHDDVAGYERTRAFFGSTIGRYANRIAGGHFTLDGTSYQLEQNNGPNTLHGGPRAFDQAIWDIAHIGAEIGEDTEASVTLTHLSPDGEGGFPGEVRASVRYALDADNNLSITMTATTSRPTVIAMTNHALFNLAGLDRAGDGAPQGAMRHRLTIPAAAFTPVDADLIPTGELRRVAGTVFDFRAGRILSDGLRDGTEAQIVIGRGYDHNFVLDKGLTAQPQLAAVLEDPASGRRLEVLTTEPGLQLYTANASDGRNIGKRGTLYRMGDGIALEPQKFPDTPNQPAFGSARLDPGQTYRHVMIYRLSTVRHLDR
ncbi:aldose epimerase family protein [Novosphingobium sp. FKTRR1]|uniref:aldose epimerase family protein n=1 Tax=Novosphingobium sp. FKTRR1 TaxID=2879118 RepID=UPI001CF07099|nr:aldose epimerase family protein [Novosphingobium sp. FKTRR1]